MRYRWTALLGLSVCGVSLNARAVRGAPPPSTTSPAPRKVTQSAVTHPAAARPKSTASLTPIQLEDQWTTALVGGDVRIENQLLAPNLGYTENAAVMNRGEVFKGVTGPDKVECPPNEGMKLGGFGDVS